MFLLTTGYEIVSRIDFFINSNDKMCYFESGLNFKQSDNIQFIVEIHFNL